MACRTLDVTVVKATGLEDVNLFSPMEVYVVLSISGDPRTRQRTPADGDGRCNPTWKQTFRFTIPADDPGHLALHVLLRTERIFGDDRDVGEVYISLRDLLASAADGGDVLRYQVHNTSSGKANGSIFLSCRVGDPVGDPAAAPNSIILPSVAKPAPYLSEVKPPHREKTGKVEEPVMAYPPPYPQAPYPPEPGYSAYPPPYYWYAPPPVQGWYGKPVISEERKRNGARRLGGRRG